MKKLFLALLMVLPMSVFAQKFAHINSASIIQSMPEYTAAQTELQTLASTYEKELKSIQDELQAKGELYEKSMPTDPEPVRQRHQQELQDLSQRLQQFYQTSQQELAKAEQDKMNAITEKVKKAIKEVGVAGGYVYIMDVTAGIPFINEALSTDVTAQVKTKLGLK